MREPQSAIVVVEEVAQDATDRGVSVAKGRGRRPLLAGVLLAVAVVAVLAAGGWGLFSALGAGQPPARMGEAVEASGGLVRVDDVTPEHMTPMQPEKFAQSGMNMSSMGMDMAPKGQRRFAVGVTLSGGEGANLRYSPEDFRITGEGLEEETGPIRHRLAAGTLGKGSAISGTLVFEVPEEAEGLELSFDGGRPVSLDLPPVEEGEGHGHGGGKPEGDGHDDHDH